MNNAEELQTELPPINYLVVRYPDSHYGNYSRNNEIISIGIDSRNNEIISIGTVMQHNPRYRYLTGYDSALNNLPEENKKENMVEYNSNLYNILKYTNLFISFIPFPLTLYMCYRTFCFLKSNPI